MSVNECMGIVCLQCCDVGCYLPFADVPFKSLALMLFPQHRTADKN